MKLRIQASVAGVVLSLIASLSAIAALKAPDFTVQTTLNHDKASVQAHAPAGHHFNTDAPMGLEIESNHQHFKPKKSTATQVDFEVPSAAKDSAKVSLYLCDDAKTFCEKHLVNTSWEGKAAAQDASKSSPTEDEKHVNAGPAPAPVIDELGFYDNRPKDAFAKARETGKPLMIDFYGIWCPPCNELKDSVFSKASFKENAVAFVQLKLDADSPVSEALSQRYGIQGFPTVIFASPQGDEISRVVGFRPMDQFLADMKNALSNPGQTFAALKAKAKKGDRAAMDRVGTIYLDRGEYDRAYRYLKDSQKEREKMLAAEIGLYDKKANRIEILKKAIQEFPDSPDSISRREDLAQALDAAKKSDEAKKVRLDLVTAAKRILTKPELMKSYDATESDLYTSMAQAYMDMGDKAQSDSAWMTAAEVLRKKIAAGAERGGTLELAYCLRKLGKTEEAAKLYQKMQKAYPDEFTFWLADAKMNMQLKDYERAHELAQSAFDHSYGANKLDSALVLATAFKNLGKPEQSKKTIARALESVPPLPPTANRAARSRIRNRVDALYKLSAELDKNSG